VSQGLEHYGSFRPVMGFDSLRDEEQRIVPSIDVGGTSGNSTSGSA